MLILRRFEEIGERFLRVQTARKTCFPEHLHDHFELELILDGEGVYTVNGIDYPFRKNTLTIMTPAHVHALRSDGVTLINAEFDGGNTVLPTWDFRTPFFLHLNEEEMRFFRTLMEEVEQTYDTHPGYASRLFACLLEKSMQCQRAVEPASERYENAIFLYVIEHFRNTLTLATIAEEFGLSASYISDLFSRKFGICFKEYLDSLRFTYACSQLSFTDLPIKEVSSNAGFADYANFSRRFREKYGKTPREYRSETKQEQ